ncbi:MAG: VWA domain-containing protein [Alphaproteobacteria bacterium]|nr:VWA domain-containing protein [Alphaproteobacteria bacterium]MBU0858944.1 VWA domain-containing protein [Alphaproteobacteria bacterium]
MADNKDKSKLTSALTTVAQPGEKKGGGLMSALGGKAVSVRDGREIQHVDKGTLNALSTVRKGSGGAAGHMAYVIDATGSRSRTWAEAQRIQSDMFREAAKGGELTVRLIHFGGYEVSDRGWHTSAGSLTSVMNKVSCSAGATQINESVERILGSSGKLPRNIVLIGDSYEEDNESLMITASKLVAHGIKVFAFLDVLDGPGSGEPAFRTLAEKTGGSFQIFGQGMNLKALCEAVAAYTTGGDDALKKLAQTSKEAKAIGAQVLRLSGPSAGPKP